MMSSTFTETSTGTSPDNSNLFNWKLFDVKSRAYHACTFVEKLIAENSKISSERSDYVNKYTDMLVKNNNNRKYSCVIFNLAKGIINEEKINVNSGNWTHVVLKETSGEGGEDYGKKIIDEQGEFVFNILYYFLFTGDYDILAINQTRNLLRRLLYFTPSTNALADFMNSFLTLAYLNKQIDKSMYEHKGHREKTVSTNAPRISAVDPKILEEDKNDEQRKNIGLL